ncbi:alpha-L-fucosidase [Sphingobacterium hungaricum]|uniref:alpha-L-fucosidase n=1 Tax=Sphingobacterium hungaricum TaxID=2082723 RepID=A0A928UZB9_9SPHI|nr:alpha-L-fucosidase [Sphingobacterium hungaricum]MBE8713829.1 carbohydrate-binding protein [Sphingobacterium hungaricum]
MKTNFLLTFLLVLAGSLPFQTATAQVAPDALRKQQLDFVNLGFGMFIHYGMPTFMDQDWSDPNAALELFDSPNLDAAQWAKAAKSANMTYGCLTTKHHSGFPIWDTKTTDYNVMNTPLGRDVVKEFADAFRKNDLEVMLYYSILDTHQEIRPNSITKAHIQMIKDQLTELLTNYGEINALVIDGWDAPWSRISYDEIPFDDIYYHIKSLQPNCLVMELNSAKYPGEALFYSDIKSYEQGAGQFISKEHNQLPAMACLPLQQNWFWKKSFPTTAVKDVKNLVNDFIIPYNDAYCNFMLNVAPNADGLMDENALAALKEIGQLYKKTPAYAELPAYESPVIASNLAKDVRSNSSWSDDMNIMDFANDDNFGSSWVSNAAASENPWYELTFERSIDFNSIVITEGRNNPSDYQLEYYKDGKWFPINAKAKEQGRIKILRFDTLTGQKIRLHIKPKNGRAVLSEVAVYHERIAQAKK